MVAHVMSTRILSGNCRTRSRIEFAYECIVMPVVITVTVVVAACMHALAAVASVGGKPGLSCAACLGVPTGLLRRLGRRDDASDRRPVAPRGSDDAGGTALRLRGDDARGERATT